MEHTCGKTVSESNKNQNVELIDVEGSLLGVNRLKKNKSNHGIAKFQRNRFKFFRRTPKFTQNKTKLYSAYSGKVPVNLFSTPNKETHILEHTVQLGRKKVLIKVLDSKMYKLDHKLRYVLSQLKKAEAISINSDDNAYYHYLTLLVTKHICRKERRYIGMSKVEKQLNKFKLTKEFDVSHKRAENTYPELLKIETTMTIGECKILRREFLIQNSPVDILFGIVEYVNFLYEKTGIVGVNNQDSLICLANMEGLDNAFWSGNYMVFGNGETQFLPLVSLDVMGHEASHGFIQGTANLIYNAHSGALNEAFADIFGVYFEFYMHKKYKYLIGEGDWFVGEDLYTNGRYLRSMKDPSKGSCPQPCMYKGRYYCDPNSKFDNGGVHINSGIVNYCFYLLSQFIQIDECFSIFFRCLAKLRQNSDLFDFRDALKSVDPENKNICFVLNKVGLTDDAVLDYIDPNKWYHPISKL
jgi:hypothetical protein